VTKKLPPLTDGAVRVTVDDVSYLLRPTTGPALIASGVLNREACRRIVADRVWPATPARLTCPPCPTTRSPGSPPACSANQRHQ